MTTKTRRPYDVTDTAQLIGMESDNFPTDPEVYSVLHNGVSISIHSPNGNGYVEIPRDQFNAIVDWYLRPQPVAEESDR